MRRISTLAIGVLAACHNVDHGGLNERCGPDKSCNPGLYCDVDTCIASPTDAPTLRDAFEGDDAPLFDAPKPTDAHVIDAPMTMLDAPTSCVNRVVPAPQAHIHTNGNSNAGQACMASGCHSP